MAWRSGSLGFNRRPCGEEILHFDHTYSTPHDMGDESWECPGWEPDPCEHADWIWIGIGHVWQECLDCGRRVWVEREVMADAVD